MKKFFIHALILAAGFAGIRGYYWYNQEPAPAGKPAAALIKSLEGAAEESSGWNLGKPEKDGEEYLVYEKKGDPRHYRVDPNGKVTAWLDKDPENKAIVMAKDKSRIRAAYDTARVALEDRYTIKEADPKEEVLVKAPKPETK